MGKPTHSGIDLQLSLYSIPLNPPLPNSKRCDYINSNEEKRSPLLEIRVVMVVRWTFFDYDWGTHGY